MTLGNMLSQMGIGTKHISERYSEYHSTPHDQQVYYSYDHPRIPSHSTFKHSYTGGGGGKKNHAALSALTLLAFLFFLHILQQCLREHMQSLHANPQIMIMSAGREAEEKTAKVSDSNKIDKTGITKSDAGNEHRVKNKRNRERAGDDVEVKNAMMKIETAQHTPKMDAKNYRNLYDYSSRNPSFSGLVNVFDKD